MFTTPPHTTTIHNERCCALDGSNYIHRNCRCPINTYNLATVDSFTNHFLTTTGTTIVTGSQQHSRRNSLLDKNRRQSQMLPILGRFLRFSGRLFPITCNLGLCTAGERVFSTVFYTPLQNLPQSCNGTASIKRGCAVAKSLAQLVPLYL